MFVFTATTTRPDSGLEVLSAFVSDVVVDTLTLLEGDCGLGNRVLAELSEPREVKNKKCGHVSWIYHGSKSDVDCHGQSPA